MPGDDLETGADIASLARVDGAPGNPGGFAQAIPPTLRHLFEAAQPRDRLPPELAVLAALGMNATRLERLARDAAAVGVTGEEALFADGASDDLYYRALARHLGALYLEDPLPLAPGTDVAAAARTGMAPLAPNVYGLRHLHAPRGRVLRLLLDRHRRADRENHAFAITTPRRLDALLRRHEGERLTREAADGLDAWDAALSARAGPARWQVRACLVVAVLAAFGFGASPHHAVTALSIIVFPLFAAAVAQRLVVIAAGRGVAPQVRPRMEDRDLPVYSVLVPLYREARVLPQLVGALDALDYPKAKLDIKILLEADDRETIAAAARLALPARYDVIVLRDGHPRTKPRALNAGLAWARGAFVVVFDAEDRPEPGQLRAAVARFAEAPDTVACLQADLVVEQLDETWISRLFTIEYAALFGVVKPGLAALGLPVPLGGTSNHFRIAALHRVGGWDAWNVTEDLDLGVRLARFGLTVASLDSWTCEEAPLTFARWLPQRSRWLKGWMITLLVATRDPRRLVRDLGWRDALSVLVSLGATVAGTLLGPQLMLLAVLCVLRGGADGAGGTPWMLWVAAWIGLLAAGIAALLWPVPAGLARIGRRDLGPWLFALPAYLLIVVVAAWRALQEALRDPQGWNKTEHGLARRRPALRRTVRPRSRSER